MASLQSPHRPVTLAQLQDPTLSQQVACGDTHVCCLADDGSVYVWGSGHRGQLGSSGKVVYKEPTWVSVPGRSQSHAQVVCTADATLCLRGSKLYVLGTSILSGILPFTSGSAVDTVPLPQPIRYVAASSRQCVCISSDSSTVYCLGNSSIGSVSDTLLREVSLGAHIVRHVACGTRHILVSCSNGDCFAAGDASHGKLGLTTAEREVCTLQRIPSLGYASAHLVKQVACGDSHSMVLTENGVVLTWGSGSGGKLGHGMFSDQRTPKVVQGLPRAWFIACSALTSAAVCLSESVSEYASVLMWGSNRYGQLGVEGFDLCTTPIPVPYFQTNRVQCTQIACGNWCTVALAEDGSIITWGSNRSKQLGSPHRDEVSLPQDIGIDTKCSGNASAFKMEVNKKMEQLQQSAHYMGGISSVSSGPYHAATVTHQGHLYAWGKNDEGQLGFGSFSPYCPRPMRVPNLNRIDVVACGTAHTLAVSAGQVFVWGSNEHGQLGLPRHECCAHPQLLSSLQGSYIVTVATGDYHSAAIERYVRRHPEEPTNELQNGRLFMWGDNQHGQVGQDPSCARVKIPSSIPCPLQEFKFASVALGSTHTMALVEHITSLEKHLFACGGGSDGQLGVGGFQDVSTLTQVLLFDASLGLHPEDLQICIAGGSSSMAIFEGGKVAIWGRQEGIEVFENSNYRIDRPVLLEKYVDGNDMTPVGGCCSNGRSAVFGKRSAIMWGRDWSLERALSRADHGFLIPPTAIPSSSSGSLASVQFGDNHGFVLCSNGQLYSWGETKEGQMGQGDPLLGVAFPNDPARPSPMHSTRKLEQESTNHFNDELNHLLAMPPDLHAHGKDPVDRDLSLVQLYCDEANLLLNSFDKMYVDELLRYQEARDSAEAVTRLRESRNQDSKRRPFVSKSSRKPILGCCNTPNASTKYQTADPSESSHSLLKLQECLLKLYLHPCLFIEMGKKVVDAAQFELFVPFSRLVLMLFGSFSAADLAKMDIIIEALLQYQLTELQATRQESWNEGALMEESLVYQLAFKELVGTGKARQAFTTVFGSIVNLVRDRAQSDEFADLSSEMHQSIDIAGLMVQELYSPKTKDALQKGIGWVVMLFLNPLRKLQGNAHSVVSRFVFRSFCFFGRTHVQLPSEMDDIRTVFQTALDIIERWVHTSPFDDPYWSQFLKKEDIVLYGQWWEDEAIRDFVIYLSYTDKGQATVDKASVVAFDHATVTPKELTLRDAEVAMLQSSICVDVVGESLTLPHSLPTKIRIRRYSLYPAPDEERALKLCTSCNLLMPFEGDGLCSLDVHEQRKRRAQLLVRSKAKLHPMEQNTRNISQQSDEIHLSLLECYLLHQALDRAMLNNKRQASAEPIHAAAMSSLEATILLLKTKARQDTAVSGDVLATLAAARHAVAALRSLSMFVSRQKRQRGSRPGQKEETWTVSLRHATLFTASAQENGKEGFQSSTADTSTHFSQFAKALKTRIGEEEQRTQSIKHQIAVYVHLIKSIRAERERIALDTEVIHQVLHAEQEQEAREFDGNCGIGTIIEETLTTLLSNNTVSRVSILDMAGSSIAIGSAKRRIAVEFSSSDQLHVFLIKITNRRDRIIFSTHIDLADFVQESAIYTIDCSLTKKASKSLQLPVEASTLRLDFVSVNLEKLLLSMPPPFYS